MRFRVGDAEIRFEDEGRGDALLFLHAFPLGLSMWDAQAAALKPSLRVIRFDARGFGGSPAGDGPLTMDGIADDAAALMDHLSLERVVLCGCSMGGYAALAFARRHPRRLRALVLQDTRATPDTDEARTNRRLLAERVLREGAEAAASAFVPKLLGVTTQRENPRLVAEVRETILANSPRGIADALFGLGMRPDSTPTLADIRVPTLVLCGAQDVLTPPADSKALHEAIAGSRLEIIPGAGHLANMEAPEAVNTALSAFASELG
jgi:pimeloyl-ACP methyl ester carboxylesterase